MNSPREGIIARSRAGDRSISPIRTGGNLSPGRLTPGRARGVQGSRSTSRFKPVSEGGTSLSKFPGPNDLASSTITLPGAATHLGWKGQTTGAATAASSTTPKAVSAAVDASEGTHSSARAAAGSGGGSKEGDGGAGASAGSIVEHGLAEEGDSRQDDVSSSGQLSKLWVDRILKAIEPPDEDIPDLLLAIASRMSVTVYPRWRGRHDSTRAIAMLLVNTFAFAGPDGEHIRKRGFQLGGRIWGWTLPDIALVRGSFEVSHLSLFSWFLSMCVRGSFFSVCVCREAYVRIMPDQRQPTCSLALMFCQLPYAP